MNVLLILVLLIGAILVILGIQYFQEQKRHHERIQRTYRHSHDLEFNESIPTEQWISKIGELTIFKPLYTPTFRLQLVQAGWLNKNAPEFFVSCVVLIIVTLLLLSIFAVVVSPSAFHLLAGSPFQLLVSFFGFVYCGFGLPKIILDRQKKSYIKIIVRELADFFELYIINIGAGKSNIDALKSTVGVIQDIYPKVGQQIHYLIGELQTLPSQELAWQNFANRIDDPEVKDAIKIIRHCDALGLPVEHDLHRQISYMRETYLTKVEEKITRLPTTLLLPMFLFIFPSLFIVILTPALLKILAAIP